MRTRTLFVSALLGLGMMASCSNEELEGLENGQNGQEETAYAQIAINVANSASTRALDSDKNTGSTVDGSDVESKVSKVTVVLADPTSNIAQYVYNFTTNDQTYKFEQGTNNANFATVPFEVPKGKYNVYVLANFGDNGISATTITAGFDMKQEITISNASKLSASNSFLMVNDVIPSATTPNGDFTGTADKTEVDGDLTEKQEGKTLFKVEVNIERVVSKVTFNQTTTSLEVKDANDVKLATASIEGVGIINTNKKMFLIREAKATNNKPNGVSSTWIYPQDPNYSKLESTALTTNFENTSVAEEAFKTDFSTATFYCPENTMEANAQLNGQTTGVVYKVTWTLNTESSNNPYTELAKDGTDSYSEIFTAILNMTSNPSKDTDIDENIFKADLTTSETVTANTFYAYNNLIFKNKKAAVLYKSIAEATGTTINDKASNANTTFSTNKNKTGDELSALNIKEYKGGVNYYPVWIKHNPDGSNMQQDKFGVVRNHWYELTVTSISNLGNDKPTFEDPEDPDDPAVANIQVAAKIKPWTIVKQEVEL